MVSQWRLNQAWKQWTVLLVEVKHSAAARAANGVQERRFYLVEGERGVALSILLVLLNLPRYILCHHLRLLFTLIILFLVWLHIPAEKHSWESDALRVLFSGVGCQYYFIIFKPIFSQNGAAMK